MYNLAVFQPIFFFPVLHSKAHFFCAISAVQFFLIIYVMNSEQYFVLVDEFYQFLGEMLI